MMVSHHGTDPSGSPQLVHALAPRVAVMQNGTRKGAGTQAMPTMRTSPGLEDIWQLHWGYGAGIEQNSAGVFIANIDDNQTIANALTAPPRGGGPGRGRRARAAGAAQVPPTVASPPVSGARAVARRRCGARTAAAAGPPAGRLARRSAGGGTPGARWRRTRRAGAAARAGATWIKVVAQQDGSFTVSNSRNGFSKTYPAHARAK